MNCYQGMTFIVQTAIALKKHFPDFQEMLSSFPDYRKDPDYKIEELLMAVIAMFLFKRSSRNGMDNLSRKGRFSSNYRKVFGCRLPDMDTCDKLLRQLPADCLERLKQEMVRVLVRRKVFDKFRFEGLYHSIAIDGTGLHSYDYEPYPGCPKQTSKNGKTSYTVYVLEAKIVCANGFSISIATEWIRNPEQGTYDKQDCELKAFVRLAQKIKKLYPRMPILLLADGLYPNNTVFDICRNYGYHFIFTFKEGNLKSVWEEVNFLWRVTKDNTASWHFKKGNWWETHNYRFINNIQYRKHIFHLIESTITRNRHVPKKDNIPHLAEKERFVHITNIILNRDNCKDISLRGRLRWAIENEGFNAQKNEGYGLSHKFSRVSPVATCNYYQCLQLAHMINQLAYLAKHVKEAFFKNEKETMISLGEFGLATMMTMKFGKTKILSLLTSIGYLKY
ncbi:MAG: hypothetical protein HN402_02400 [Candidatus Scalindua sp.]|nr:hypothetical protein [Candidatus Scalindua sp.]